MESKRSPNVGLEPTTLRLRVSCSSLNYVTIILCASVELLINCIVGSVVECSPATRAARVRFPDDAYLYFVYFLGKRKIESSGGAGYRSRYLPQMLLRSPGCSVGRAEAEGGLGCKISRNARKLSPHDFF